MYCKYCGKEIPDGSNFCKYCGENLNVVEVNTSAKKYNFESREQVSECATIRKSRMVIVSIIMVICAVALIIFAIFHYFNKRPNINKYIEVACNGYNDYGLASYEIDTALLEQYPGIDNYITVALSDDSCLSNGATINVHLSVDEEKLFDNYRIIPRYSDYGVEVKGLDDIARFNAFENIEIEYVGIAPNAYAEVRSNNDFVVTVEPDSNLSNGDKIVASIDDLKDQSSIERIVNKYNALPEKISKEFTASGVNTAIETADDLPADFIDDFNNKCINQVFDDIVDSDDLNKIFDTDKFYVVKNQLLLPKDENSSNNMLLSIIALKYSWIAQSQYGQGALYLPYGYKNAYIDSAGKIKIDYEKSNNWYSMLEPETNTMEAVLAEIKNYADENGYKLVDINNANESETDENVFWSAKDLNEFRINNIKQYSNTYTEVPIYSDTVGIANERFIHTTGSSIYDEYATIDACLNVQFKHELDLKDGDIIKPSDLIISYEAGVLFKNNTIVNSDSYVLKDNEFYINNPIYDSSNPYIQLVVNDVYGLQKNNWPNLKLVYNWAYNEQPIEFEKLQEGDFLGHYIGFYVSTNEDNTYYIIENSHGDQLVKIEIIDDDCSDGLDRESLSGIPIISTDDARVLYPDSRWADGPHYSEIMDENLELLAIVY